MRFWDTSAIVPLLLEESATEEARALYRDDPSLLVWWGTAVECVSAVARREREGAITVAVANAALARLDTLAEHWSEVIPVDAVRQLARRALRVHPLRAADALQLGAALHASEHQPATLPVVTFDQRLADAASREGFPVVSRRG